MSRPGLSSPIDRVIWNESTVDECRGCCNDGEQIHHAEDYWDHWACPGCILIAVDGGSLTAATRRTILDPCCECGELASVSYEWESVREHSVYDAYMGVYHHMPLVEQHRVRYCSECAEQLQIEGVR